MFWQHLPLVMGIDDKEHYPLDVGIGDLKTWRKQRSAKSLYELQIEVCEMAIKALAKVASLPEAEKEQARKKIKAEIANLKKTKRPIHLRAAWPDYEVRGVYDTKLAKRVREGIKSGKYGDLGIIK